MTAKRWWPAVVVLALVTAAGCTASDEKQPRSDQAPAGTAKAVSLDPPAAGKTGTIDLDGRPFKLRLPPNYHPATKGPLLVLLHGYQSAGSVAQEQYFKLTPEIDRRGFIYAMPDGMADPQGKKFWNASRACCDFYEKGVDDSAYLSKLIDTVAVSYAVDRNRVYLVGHSNGGFMAHRMACDHAAQVTAIVSVAGMTTNDAAQCKPERAVTVLQIHGTADEIISYRGGENGPGRPYPSVDTTIATWRQLDGCTEKATISTPIDLVATDPGAETTVTTYADGCRNATRVVLWSMKDGLHSPEFSDAFASSIMDFLEGQVAPA